MPVAEPGEDGAEEAVTREGVTTEPEPAPVLPSRRRRPRRPRPPPPSPLPRRRPRRPPPSSLRLPSPPLPRRLRTEKPRPASKAKASKKAHAADTANVTISDYRFTAATVTVVVGDTVTWTNDGPSAHSATATGGSFDTGIFPAESRSATFDEADLRLHPRTPHLEHEGRSW